MPLRNERKVLLQLIAAYVVIMLSAIYYVSYPDQNHFYTAFVLSDGDEGTVLTQVDTAGEKLAALTFDDGPDPRYTPHVLDILKRYDICATFFVVGESAEACPELIERELLEGHEIENHTYTHADLRFLDAFNTEEEIGLTGEVIQRLTHRQATFFRPPRKLFRRETLEIAGQNGYKTVLWTICLENRAMHSPQEMAQRVVKAACPGMIILTHDGVLDRSKSLEALPILIEALQGKGYRFVTLDELVRIGAVNARK